MGSRVFVTLSLVCVSLCCCRALRSQIVSNEVLQAPSQPRTISGVVLNTVTGRPIPRALVQAGDAAMLTDGEGHFEFSDVTGGGLLTATKPGYFSENTAGMMPRYPAGQSEDGPFELRLVPEAVLSGRVTDSHGVPLEGVSVMLRTLAVSNGLKHWEQRFGTVTNAEGEFRFAELQAGEYALQTTLKPAAPPEGEAAIGYAPAEYPEIDPSGAGALQVHAGDRLEADMSTRLERLYPISGVVTGFSGNNSLSISVHTAGETDFNRSLQQDPQSGAFRVLLPSGSFELRAQSYVQPQLSQLDGPRGMSSPPSQLAARLPVTVANRPVGGLRMTLEPMATVAVEIAEEKIANPPGSYRFLPPSPAGITLSLLPMEADAAPAVYYAEHVDDHGTPGSVTQTDGPRVIRNLPPGRYFLQAQGDPSWHIASASCGGTDLTREPIAIADGGAAGCTMRVVLRDDLASLKVSVSEAQGGHATPAFIYLVPLNNLTRDVQMFVTGMDGKTSLDGVASGQYLLLATRQQAQLAFREAESLHRYETEGRRVDLAPGANAEVQLDVIHGEP